MFETLKEKYRQYKDRCFLKKHGCENWRQYNHRYDPDYNYRANRIVDYYHGYPYVYCFENRDHFAYQLLYDYGPGGVRYGYYDIIEWCEKNLTDKFRMDYHRAIKAPNTAYQWEINELGGGDYIFAAFKNQQDYIWFMLRWS